MIDVNDKRTGELAKYVDQEMYDLPSGPPGSIQIHIPIDGPDGFGLPGGISESRSDN